MAKATQTAPRTIFDEPERVPAEATRRSKGRKGAKPRRPVPERPAPPENKTFGDRVRNWPPFLLARAAHPRQTFLTAAAVTGAAALTDRTPRELAVVGVTVLVGQSVLGWHNDLVDEGADRRHDRPGKPVADGRLDPGSAWFALCCGILLLIPLAVTSGVIAGLAYLASVVIGMLGNVVLRRGLFSWVPWVLSFALYPYFLAYGGWAGAHTGGPPEVVMVLLAAALGLGVHFFTALWGLVADNEDGWTYLPLKLGLKLGAGKLLLVTLVYLALVVGGLAYAGNVIGLRA